jgi:hypothetical protein
MEIIARPHVVFVRIITLRGTRRNKASPYGHALSGVTICRFVPNPLSSENVPQVPTGAISVCNLHVFTVT